MYSPVRPDWLKLHSEEIIDPGREIVDAHHHLWDRPAGRYLMDEMVADVNKTLRGWYGYFKYSLPTAMQRVDEWTRERIRHILRRRQRRRGMVRGRERTEYPIAWFEKRGLFSLKAAQAKWLQSLAGNH